MPHPWPECLQSLAACLRDWGAPQRRGLFGFVSFPVPLLPEVRFLDTNFELQWNHLTNDVESLWPSVKVCVAAAVREAICIG